MQAGIVRSAVAQIGGRCWSTALPTVQLIPQGTPAGLANNDIGPICAVSQTGMLATPQDLMSRPLLGTDSYPAAWEIWARASDLDAGQLRPVRSFGQLIYLIQATIAGLGVGIAPSLLVQEELKQGRAMCAHSLEEARAAGYRAMQFNLVLASNHRAVALWQRMGLQIVGRVPEAFLHPVQGYTDALGMYRRL